MRKARADFLLVALVAASTTPLCSGLAFAQRPPTQAVASQPVPEADAPHSAQEPAEQATANCPGHPNALGTSRILAIDPAQYRRIGHMQYSDSLPLADKEVVLTFDDGPILPYSNQILDILASQCVKATYFLVGEMARAFPPGCAAFTRKDTRSARTASTIRPGSANCRSRECVMRSTEAFPTSAPHWAIPNISHRSSVFPVWRDPMSSKANSQARGLSVFSSDTDADDWHHRISGPQIIALAMRRLEVRGKGILLLHDIHPATVAALPGLLKELKDNGFHIVQVVRLRPT